MGFLDAFVWLPIWNAHEEFWKDKGDGAALLLSPRERARCLISPVQQAQLHPGTRARHEPHPLRRQSPQPVSCRLFSRFGQNGAMDPTSLSELEKIFVLEGESAARFEWKEDRPRKRRPLHVSQLKPDQLQFFFEMAVARHNREILKAEQSPHELGYAFAHGIVRAKDISTKERRASSWESHSATLQRAIRRSKTPYWSDLFRHERTALAAVLSGEISSSPQTDRLETYRVLWRAVDRMCSPILEFEGHHLTAYSSDESHRYLEAIRLVALSDHASSPWQVYEQHRRRRIAVDDSEVFRLVYDFEYHMERGRQVTFLECLDDRDTDLAHAQNTKMREYHLERSRAALDKFFGPLVELAEGLRSEMEATADALRLRRNRENAVRPAPQPYGVSAAGAELWVRDTIRWLGAPEAETTQVAGDGGVDVLTDSHAISVKNYAGNVPVEAVREIFGVAVRMDLKAMLWTSGVVSGAGREFADAVSMPLVRYDVLAGTFTALNGPADAILEGLLD